MENPGRLLLEVYGRSGIKTMKASTPLRLFVKPVVTLNSMNIEATKKLRCESLQVLKNTGQHLILPAPLCSRESCECFPDGPTCRSFRNSRCLPLQRRVAFSAGGALINWCERMTYWCHNFKSQSQTHLSSCINPAYAVGVNHSSPIFITLND